MEPATAPPPVHVSPARAALARGAIAAASLALTVPIVTVHSRRDVALDATLGLGLGLVVGLMTSVEHLARCGSLRLALTWATAIAPLGVLTAATQAGFVAHVLAAGRSQALEATHLAMWLVALDPLTVPTIAVLAVALTVVPLQRGLVGSRARTLALASLLVLAGASFAVLANSGAFERLVVQSWAVKPGELRFGLPVGPEVWDIGRSALQDHRAGLEVMKLSAILLLASAASAWSAERVVRAGMGEALVGDDAPPRAGAVVSATLSSATLVVLAVLSGRAPPAAVLPAFARMPGSGSHRAMARIGPADRALVPPILALLAASTTPGPARARLVNALERIGPPADDATVQGLVAAVTQDRDFELTRAAVQAIRTLEVERAVLIELFRREAHGRWWVPYGLRSPAPFGWLGREDYLALARDPDPAVARAAVERIAGPTSDRTRIPELEQLLPDPTVGDLAALAIANTGEPALALLRERLARPGAAADPLVMVLHNLPQNSAALTLLRDALASPHEPVRAAATKGLRADGPRGAWRGGAEVLVERLTVAPDAAEVADALATYRRRGVAAIDSALTADLAPEVRVSLEQARSKTAAR